LRRGPARQNPPEFLVEELADFFESRLPHRFTSVCGFRIDAADEEVKAASKG
jgi:hypothetical protein